MVTCLFDFATFSRSWPHLILIQSSHPVLDNGLGLFLLCHLHAD